MGDFDTAGMVAPETAACLSELIKITNAHYSSQFDGEPSEPEALVRASIFEHHQRAFGEIPELRRRIVAVLCQHYKLLHGIFLMSGHRLSLAIQERSCIRKRDCSMR